MKRLILIPVILVMFLINCGRSTGNKHVERSRFLMDTLVKISIYDRDLPEEEIVEAIEKTFLLMESLEKRTSLYHDSSDVFKISENEVNTDITLSPEVFEILNQSIDISEKTDGAFDVTIGAVKQLWHFDSDHSQIPDELFLTASLKKVNYHFLQLLNKKVRLLQPGMVLDLGGVAKGYIIDRAIELLKNQGLKSGIVDAGGDLRIFGEHPERIIWKIGIRHPRKGSADFLGVLTTGEASVATSGDYERYFVKNGIRYHHILDPVTGYPANRCVSVTIQAETALLADAYATAIFVIGQDKGISFIEKIESIEGLIVYEEENQLKTIISSGLCEKIVLQNFGE